LIIGVGATILWQRYELSGERIDEEAKSALQTLVTASTPLIWNFDVNALKEVQQKSTTGMILSIGFYDNTDRALVPLEDPKTELQVFTQTMDATDNEGKKVGRVEIKYHKQRQADEFAADAKMIGAGFGLVLIFQILASSGVFWANRKIFD